jgi:hypothetical protein
VIIFVVQSCGIPTNGAECPVADCKSHDAGRTSTPWILCSDVPLSTICRRPSCK